MQLTHMPTRTRCGVPALIRVFPLLLVLAGGVPHPAAAAPALTTRVRLVLSHESARPGDTVWLGVHLKLAPDWHVYWENSGDSGIPTRVDWSLPSGLQAGQLLWPPPERFETTGIVTYGSRDEVLLLAPLSLPPTLPAGVLAFRARVSWLECISEKCVPGSAEITGQVTVGSATAASVEGQPLVDLWRSRLPQPKPNDFARAWWETQGNGTSATVRPLSLEWPAGPGLAQPDF